MLLPPLNSVTEYIDFANLPGFQLLSARDISKSVSKTWDICFDLVQKPALWKLAAELGGDFMNFLKSFQAMRKGFKRRAFVYGVLAFEKVVIGKKK
jgi:hypothetical protein